MSVPPALSVPLEAPDDYRREVDRVNEYLAWARGHMYEVTVEVERLSKTTGDAVLMNGPNGIILE